MPETQLSNGELFWKSLEPFFRRTYALSVGFKMKSVRKSVSCVNPKKAGLFEGIWHPFIFQE